LQQEGVAVFIASLDELLASLGKRRAGIRGSSVEMHVGSESSEFTR
jgi:hypothetical protein